MKKLLVYLLPVFLLAVLFQCRPERAYIQDDDARLEFSLDTVFFDTVFTTVASVTKSFRVYNPHKDFIKIDGINLAGGEQSVFRVNVDGTPGISFENFEIGPEDSMYVFVEATLENNNDPEILRIQDSILFTVNGNLQDVDLVAWGQDVHMHHATYITENTYWPADKPYLILEGIVVERDQTLSIEAGAQIHMHRDAIIIVDGTLELLGETDNQIVIQGDRLEKEYIDDPGYPSQWRGLYFAPGSENNRIENTLIRNGVWGLWADSVVSYDQPVLSIKNSEIQRMSYAGIVGNGTTIAAENTIIGDCGSYGVQLLIEGSYSFNHCTLANYWSRFSNRTTPLLMIANYYVYYDTITEENVVVSRDIDQADFTNCIIYGPRGHEVFISHAEGGALNYKFDYVLAKMDTAEHDYIHDPFFTNIIANSDPLFDTIPVSYELDSLSPAINAASFDYSLSVPLDKKGYNRFSDQKPDLGALEKIDN